MPTLLPTETIIQSGASSVAPTKSPESFGRTGNILPFPVNASGLHLFADVETDGFGHSGGVPAYVVEVGAILTDAAGVEIAALSAIVIPDGFEIPEGATAVNGITTEMAHALGVPLWQAMWHFERLARCASTIIAHNREFDMRVIGGAYVKLGMLSDLHTKGSACTMLDSVDVCRIPNKKGAGFKRPNLDELHLHLFGEPRKAAHGALVDTRDCAKCYFEMQRRKGLMP